MKIILHETFSAFISTYCHSTSTLIKQITELPDLIVIQSYLLHPVHKCFIGGTVDTMLKFRNIASKQGSALVYQDRNDPKMK